MADSTDSGLFGKNDELYTSKRHRDEVEPFAQATPHAGEPLFPAAPAVADRSWVEATPPSIVYDHKPLGASLFEQEAPAPAIANQKSGSQNNGHSLYGAQLYGVSEPATDAAASLYASSTAASPAVTSSAVPSVTPSATAPATPAVTPTVPAPAAREATAALYDFGTTKEETPVLPHRPMLTEREMLFNRQFAVLMDLMQHGAWPQALEKLHAMRTEYPNVATLEALLDEATLKADLMAQWTHKIKGRRLTVGQEWLIRRSLPFLLLFALFVSGAIFYRTFVAPSRQVVAMERANQALVEEATGLVQVGQIYEAIDLYNVVLSRDPNNAAAQQGLTDANRLAGLAVSYDIAIRVANKGNLERSLLLLQSIKAKSSSFRDIDARIARVEGLLDAEKAYQLAEKAFAQHRWVDAITYYEETQLLASDYQEVRVGIQMTAAYFLGAQKLMTQWPTPEFGTEQIRTFVRKAQEFNNQDASIAAFLPALEDFIKGERALNNNNLGQAIEIWRELYDAQPAFLGGYLAEQLYRAYLALASEVRTADPEYARELLTLAAEMPVRDSSEARYQLQTIGAVVPAAQPTPTALPTVAYVAPMAVAAAPVIPVDTPTPEPTATPANSYQGWIAFRSTRDGTEKVYVMRRDGSEQQLAPEELRSRLDALYQDERRATDGRVVYVQSATGRSDANIYLTSSDGVSISTLTDQNGDEYDPVWSRTEDRIAFVSNNTGNDEIWSMRADGGEQRQLTFNNWEWDKHPTWSPDGREIAFFSNRSGQRQIWVMSSDGSGQRNISSNIYDDWDPVWIK